MARRFRYTTMHLMSNEMGAQSPNISLRVTLGCLNHSLTRKEPDMYKFAAVVIFVAFTSCLGATGAWADDPMSQKEAKPDLKERLMKDAVKGTLMQMNGEHYVIKDDNGKEIRVHVDTSTKMDKVVKGDRVKAYITEKGHATTLQRVEK
jgi:hypothetical protein